VKCSLGKYNQCVGNQVQSDVIIPPQSGFPNIERMRSEIEQGGLEVELMDDLSREPDNPAELMRAVGATEKMVTGHCDFGTKWRVSDCNSMN